MKNRLLLMLVVSAALVITSWAQQNNQNSSTAQTASGSQNVSVREPLQAPKGQNFWDGDDPNIVNLVRHPFATKAYVLRHTQPIRDRINELDELTSENSRMIKDADARAQQGLQMASEKVSLADQHATDASSKAVEAQKAASEASMRASSAEQLVANLSEYRPTSQTEIRFRAGQSVLSKKAKEALDAMATPLKNEHGYLIEVRGFAPGSGRIATRNAQKMADSVVRYLVLTQGLPMYRIHVISMGNGASTAAGKTAHRSSRGRVEISVLQNTPIKTAQR